MRAEAEAINAANRCGPVHCNVGGTPFHVDAEAGGSRTTDANPLCDARRGRRCGPSSPRSAGPRRTVMTLVGMETRSRTAFGFWTTIPSYSRTYWNTSARVRPTRRVPPPWRNPATRTGSGY